MVGAASPRSQASSFSGLTLIFFAALSISNAHAVLAHRSRSGFTMPRGDGPAIGLSILPGRGRTREPGNAQVPEQRKNPGRKHRGLMLDACPAVQSSPTVPV